MRPNPPPNPKMANAPSPSPPPQPTLLLAYWDSKYSPEICRILGEIVLHWETIAIRMAYSPGEPIGSLFDREEREEVELEGNAMRMKIYWCLVEIADSICREIPVVLGEFAG